MTNFDDEMRRVFADRRIGQVPDAPMVSDIVQGASRRRTRRVVVSAVSAAGVMAAVAVGATALGNFTNTAAPDVAPAVTSTDTADPTPPPNEPTEDPTVDPTTPPSDPSTDPSEPSDPPDDLPVLDPTAIHDGVRMFMTLRELRLVEGVEIEEFTADEGRTGDCYGSYRKGEVSGLIGIPGTDEQADPEDLFIVATLALDGPFQTPEGITVGSSLGELEAAYDYLQREPNYASAPASTGWWVFDGIFTNGTDGGDTVTGIHIDAGHGCFG